MSAETATALLRELYRLVEAEEARASAEAASVPYWARCPESVTARRAAARVLREDAERLQGLAIAS